MSINPFILRSLAFAKQERSVSNASHRLEVEAVYQESKPIPKEMFKEIQKYCENHRITFYARPYSSDVFWEDREYIERLPAFHIYYKTEYEKTVYPEDDLGNTLEYILTPKVSSWKSKLLLVFRKTHKPVDHAKED